MMTEKQYQESLKRLAKLSNAILGTLSESGQMRQSEIQSATKYDGYLVMVALSDLVRAGKITRDARYVFSLA